MPHNAYQPDLATYVFQAAKSIFLPGTGNINYDEIAQGSPVYSLSHGNSKVERTYICLWEDRQSFVRAMLGYPKLRSSSIRPFRLLGQDLQIGTPKAPPNDYYVSRVIPHSIPDIVDPSGGESFLYARAVNRMEGKGPKGIYGPDGVPAYHFAIVTVQYESLTFKVASDSQVFKSVKNNTFGVERDRFITKLRKPSAEYISLPRGIYRWYDATLPLVATPVAVDFASSRLIPSMELIYHWHEVPFLPMALFRNYVGSVNKDVFADAAPNDTNLPRDPAASDGYAPGTLLLLSVEVKPYRTAVGSFVHDITYRMKYYEPEPGRGHNFFLRYKNSTTRLHFTKITDTGDNDEVPIPTADPPYPNRLPDNTGPYPRTLAFPIPAGTARAVYPYKNFYNLFSFNTDDVIV